MDVSVTLTSEAAGVGGEEAWHAARAVMDLKLGPIGLVGAGLSAVVAVVSSWFRIMRLRLAERENLLQATSQTGHVAEGTQRLLDPVSKMTLKPWPGVPSSMGP